MNSYSPTFTAALASEHQNDLFRAAARSRSIAEVSARERHNTPRHRTAWWSRVTSRGAHRAASSGA